MYKTDNRRKKNRGRYTFLGIVLGVILTVGGLYVYDNYKIPEVTQIQNTLAKELPKAEIIQQVIKNNPAIQKVDNQQSQQVTEIPIQRNEIQTINNIDLEHTIHSKINILREQNGLKDLKYDENLATIAREHSKDMVDNNYFDHTSPSGQTLENRLYINKYPCYPSGENIQQNYVSDSLDNSIIQTWMDSPAHRENILEPTFDREGIGIVLQANTVLITEDFC